MAMPSVVQPKLLTACAELTRPSIWRFATMWGTCLKWPYVLRQSLHGQDASTQHPGKLMHQCSRFSFTLHNSLLCSVCLFP